MGSETETDASNVVYLGDDVVLRGSVHDTSVVLGDANGITNSKGSSCDFDQWHTPDGKPVTGFGGARVDITEGDASDWVIDINGVQVTGWRHSADRERATGVALAIADMIFGRWQRPFTESDLKRRGLL